MVFNKAADREKGRLNLEHSVYKMPKIKPVRLTTPRELVCIQKPEEMLSVAV